MPELAGLEDGSLLLSWLEPRAGGGHTLRMAVRRQGTWSEPRTVASDEDVLLFSASLPAVVPLPGRRGLVAYWELKDHSGPDPFAERITMAVSKDEGRTWSKPFVLHKDGVPGEHAFVSAFPVADRIGLVWLDARGQRYVPPAPGESQATAQWLGSVGLFYSSVAVDGRLGPEAVIDPLTCECCPTAAAVTARGPLVAYRDRSPLPSSGEVRYDQNVVRDIYVSRLEGGRWAAPRRVHADDWVFNGCPDNGPAVAADGGRVAVAWWTSPDGEPAVKVAFSSDAGDTFDPPVRIDEGSGQGQVTVSLAGGGAVAGWLEAGKTLARFVSPRGELGPVAALGPAAHHSRLPRWPGDGTGLWAAWTEGSEAEGGHRVRLARLRLD